MMRVKRTAVHVALTALLLSACGDQTGTPQPLPIPSPREMRLGGAPTDVEMDVEIVGLPGAVAGAGQVVIVNNGVSTEAQSTAAGSFFASIRAHGDDELEIRYENSDAAIVTVPVKGIMYPGIPFPIEGVPPLTPQGDGQVLVRGELPSAGVALVVNVSNGAVVLGAADALQQFSLEIQAASGDALRVYQEMTPLGPFWELTVP
ncbi:MAG: hypothetical protein JRH20_25330 [Deltaproteobacteria bacterium]|nr:hypothetical protein [Deltaproteobacteria bacterium]